MEQGISMSCPICCDPLFEPIWRWPCAHGACVGCLTRVFHTRPALYRRKTTHMLSKKTFENDFPGEGGGELAPSPRRTPSRLNSPGLAPRPGGGVKNGSGATARVPQRVIFKAFSIVVLCCMRLVPYVAILGKKQRIASSPWPPHRESRCKRICL